VSESVSLHCSIKGKDDVPAENEDVSVEKEGQFTEEKGPIFLNQKRFEWAWFTVNTRAVYLAADPRDAGGQQSSPADSLALAPYLDLLNHSAGVRVEAGINIQTSAHRKYKEQESFLHFCRFYYRFVLFHTGSLPDLFSIRIWTRIRIQLLKSTRIRIQPKNSIRIWIWIWLFRENYFAKIC